MADGTERDGGDGLVRVRAFDERRLVFDDAEWPVDAPPFREPELRGPVHAVEYAAMRAAQRVALALPRPLRAALIAGVAGTARRIDRRHRDAAREFVAAALPDATPEEREAIAREAWRHLLRVAVVAEGLPRHVLGRRLGECYDLYAAPAVVRHLEELSRGQRIGALLLTAHVGFWEAGAPALVALGFRPGYAVGKAPRNDFTAAHVQRTREAQGMRLLPRNGAMQAVPAVVRAGGSVGMLLDHKPRQKPVFAPFFGRPAACDRSVGVLLRRVGAPMLFYACYGTKDPWRFELRFPKLMAPEELDGLSPEEIAARVNRELEALILHRPREYFWLHDRYRGAPRPADGEPSGEAAGAASPERSG